MIGDDEPEDAWDADDPTRELVTNLTRRVVVLLVDDDALDVLDVLGVLVAFARLRVLSARATLRADQIDQDIAFLRARLAAEGP